jgi:hypothetical protein
MTTEPTGPMSVRERCESRRATAKAAPQGGSRGREAALVEGSSP